MPKGSEFNFEISLSVLNHLGRNLYRNFVTVLGEAISNSWDAKATNVWIHIDRDNDRFFIADDGTGMGSTEFQERFLKIGYSKRKDPEVEKGDRPFIGAKGIGKLALLSCADSVSVFSRKAGGDFIGGRIENRGLDNAISEDLTPSEYELETLEETLLDWVKECLPEVGLPQQGTVLCFEGMKDSLRNTPEYLRRLLALSFAFSTVDPNFHIHLNGQTVSVADLSELAEKTQFLWTINGHDDAYLQSVKNLALPAKDLERALRIGGYIASVELPRHLKVRGKDDRATIDLFVNGRIRERNLLRRLPTARVTESYLYGQIHFDGMDNPDEKDDPFTSSREGVKEDNPEFRSLIDELRNEIIPLILKEWDENRRKINEDGDDDEPAMTVPERRAESLYNEASKGYSLPQEDGNHDIVEEWLSELKGEATFNLPSYVNCFLSENLVRKYIHHDGKDATKFKGKIGDWSRAEETNKAKANISFEIRQDNDPLFYLDMEQLADIADPQNKDSNQNSLWRDGISYKPVRNVVGHTGLVTEEAKGHLGLVLANIASRVKRLLSQK